MTLNMPHCFLLFDELSESNHVCVVLVSLSWLISVFIQRVRVSALSVFVSDLENSASNTHVAVINIDSDKVSAEARQEILHRSRNDKDPEAFFIRKVSEGIGSIAAAFYPRPIIVRLGDFKS
jgi:phosphoenolpyruvate synthase/pyruvate phosphate dikinase